MAKSDREQDLVVCLTALENKVVGVESLLAVLEDWLDTPTTSLVPLLRERGVLAEAQLDELSEKVAERLAASGLETASMWKTLPAPLSGSLLNPLEDLEADSTEPSDSDSTLDRTSALPAPIVGGKNDERFSIVSKYAEGVWARSPSPKINSLAAWSP